MPRVALRPSASRNKASARGVAVQHLVILIQQQNAVLFAVEGGQAPGRQHFDVAETPPQFDRAPQMRDSGHAPRRSSASSNWPIDLAESRLRP